MSLEKCKESSKLKKITDWETSYPMKHETFGPDGSI